MRAVNSRDNTLNATARMKVYGMNGQLLVSKEKAVTLPPLSSVEVFDPIPLTELMHASRGNFTNLIQKFLKSNVRVPLS